MSENKYEAYTMMIERNKKNKQTGEWEKLPPQPYRTVDGRCVEAADRAGDKPYSILTWANTASEPVYLQYGDLPLVIMPGTCVSLYKDARGGLFIGTAAISGVMGSDASSVENGETSSIGRALGVAGIGIIPGQAGIASADEMKKAMETTKKASPKSADNPADTIMPYGKYGPDKEKGTAGLTLGEIAKSDANYLEWLALTMVPKNDDGKAIQAAAKKMLDSMAEDHK